jgi:hypothetical protein
MPSRLWLHFHRRPPTGCYLQHVHTGERIDVQDRVSYHGVDPDSMTNRWLIPLTPRLFFALNDGQYTAGMDELPPHTTVGYIASIDPRYDDPEEP